MKALGVFGEKGNLLGVFGENGNLLGVSMERANSDCNGERSKKRSIEAVEGSGSESNSEFLGLVRWRPLGPSIIVGFASST